MIKLMQAEGGLLPRDIHPWKSFIDRSANAPASENSLPSNRECLSDQEAETLTQRLHEETRTHRPKSMIGRKSLKELVARDGIEQPTRGFSSPGFMQGFSWVPRVFSWLVWWWGRSYFNH
jgi:hypothetical protein